MIWGPPWQTSIFRQTHLRLEDVISVGLFKLDNDVASGHPGTVHRSSRYLCPLSDRGLAWETGPGKKNTIGIAYKDNYCVSPDDLFTFLPCDDS